jgi:hypothetical protein
MKWGIARIHLTIGSQRLRSFAASGYGISSVTLCRSSVDGYRSFISAR